MLWWWSMLCGNTAITMTLVEVSKVFDVMLFLTALCQLWQQPLVAARPVRKLPEQLPQSWCLASL